jgi:hypothetical protein
MKFDSNLPDHFFFEGWGKPQSVKYLHPFVSQRGGVNNDKVFNVVELDYGDFKLQVCIDNNNFWAKKC